MKPLDIRDIAIIDAFPVYDYEKTVLNVGCGEGRIDFHLARLEFKVYATDISCQYVEGQSANPAFSQADIFNLSSFPIKKAPVVICSEVLEHLPRYKEALKNLLNLTGIRLIITVPYKQSFGGKNAGHCNFWSDENVGEFIGLCSPNSIAISKIRTKPTDVQLRQFCYLIVVDRRQDKCGKS
ncbi:hypothetical protein ES703_55895 [subsurface metagenome]